MKATFLDLPLGRRRILILIPEYDFIPIPILGRQSMQIPMQILGTFYQCCANMNTNSNTNKHKFVQKVAKKNRLLIFFEYCASISSVHKLSFTRLNEVKRY